MIWEQQMSEREILMLITMLICAVVGAVANYWWLKKDKNEKPKRESLLRCVYLGAVAGFILWLITQGGMKLEHYNAWLTALIWGFGWETIIGKYLGGREKKKEAERIATEHGI